MTEILVYDQFTDRFLKTSEQQVRQAEEKLNEILKEKMAEGKEVIRIEDFVAEVLGLPYYGSYTQDCH